VLILQCIHEQKLTLPFPSSPNSSIFSPILHFLQSAFITFKTLPKFPAVSRCIFKVLTNGLLHCE
jgi:hypothetical protein